MSTGAPSGSLQRRDADSAPSAGECSAFDCLPTALISTPRPHARMRVICFPYGGGSATAYARWPAQLPDDIETVAIELPGHGRLVSRRLRETIQPLAAQLAAIVAGFDDKPFVLFGHSLGALLAFVVTRELEQSQRTAPQHLVLSGCRPPHLRSELPAVCALSEQDFLQNLRDRRSIPESLLSNRRFMELVSPIIRADFRLIVSYRHPPHEQTQVPTTIYSSVTDSIAPFADVERWRELSAGESETVRFPGEHFFIEEHQPLVLEHIAALCTRVSNDYDDTARSLRAVGGPTVVQSGQGNV